MSEIFTTPLVVVCVIFVPVKSANAVPDLTLTPATVLLPSVNVIDLTVVPSICTSVPAITVPVVLTIEPNTFEGSKARAR